MRAGPSAILPDPSVARKVDREMFVLLGGAAALLMQISHPLVAAAVERHSDFRRHPVGRLRRTLDTTLSVVFGDDSTSGGAIERVNALHSRVRGVAHDGSAYDARDPRLLLWVQTTLVLTSLRLYELVMGPLPAAERERYWQETRPIARLLHIPEDLLPPTLAALEQHERQALAEDVVPDDTARAVARDVLRPLPWLPDVLYWPSDAIAAALLPPSLRVAVGLRYGDAERRFFRGVVQAVRWVRPFLPDALAVVPQARRYEQASRARATA